MSETNTALLEKLQVDAEPAEPMHTVKVGKIAIPCESGSVAPCIEKNPLPATFMVRFADCNCELEPEDLTSAFCDGCFHLVYDARSKAPFVFCNCGVKFKPGHTYFADIVPLP